MQFKLNNFCLLINCYDLLKDLKPFSHVDHYNCLTYVKIEITWKLFLKFCNINFDHYQLICYQGVSCIQTGGTSNLNKRSAGFEHT
jgi:hypothetical protein